MTPATASTTTDSTTSTSSSQPPCPGSERLTQVGPFRFNDEPVGYRIDAALMRRCLESCFAQAKAAGIVAACSDWWIKHADARGAGSTNCAILGRIAARALDSAKTARLWSLPPMLKVRRVHFVSWNEARLADVEPPCSPYPPPPPPPTPSLQQPAHQPFYLQRGKAFDPTNPQHREEARAFAAGPSLLGQLHMKVRPALEAEAALAQAPRTRQLDPDLRAEVCVANSNGYGAREQQPLT